MNTNSISKSTLHCNEQILPTLLFCANKNSRNINGNFLVVLRKDDRNNLVKI